MSETKRKENEVGRELIRQLRTNPGDLETAAVLADWCEERGFDYPSRILKDKNQVSDDGGILAFRSHEYHRVLSSLQALIGDVTPEGAGSSGKYSAIAGFPSVLVRPGEYVTISTQLYVNMTLRRLVISNGHYYNVRDIKTGKYTLMMNAEPISGELFGLNGPDLFEQKVYISQLVAISLENISAANITFQGCVLGDEWPDPPLPGDAYR